MCPINYTVKIKKSLKYKLLAYCVEMCYDTHTMKEGGMPNGRKKRCTKG